MEIRELISSERYILLERYDLTGFILLAESELLFD
jgi:hypothetical protein